MAQSAPQHNTIRFLALGDSYTIGERVPEHERWPVLLAEAFRKNGIACDDPVIIATTGWRTDELRQAILSADLPQNFNLVSLLIGVNNQYQGKSAESYRSEFEELLSMAVSLAGGKKDNVFVVSIPDYGYTPFGKEKRESIGEAIDAFNAVNQSVTAQYGIRYFNITGISRKGLLDPELIADDGLHPSGKMYAQWVALFSAHLMPR